MVNINSRTLKLLTAKIILLTGRLDFYPHGDVSEYSGTNTTNPDQCILSGVGLSGCLQIRMFLNTK